MSPFIKDIINSFLTASVLVLLWYILDKLIPSGDPWHYSEAWIAVFTGALCKSKFV